MIINNPRQPEVEINDRIRDPKIFLIGDDGKPIGTVSAAEGNRIADDKGLDLVKINPNANPPVCKLMDFQKFKFERAKKEKEARKNQKTIEIKKIWLSMTIETHDLETKAKACSKFLKAKNKVEVSIRMRGRQQAYAKLGIDIMNKFYEIVSEYAVIEKAPLAEGRNILMILGPKN